jgi:hypothetical protein
MKNFKLILLSFAVVIGIGVFIFNKGIVTPITEQYELTQDSLSAYIGREIIVDSVPHVLVDFNVVKNEYTTDKGITMSYEFADFYFKSQDTISVDGTKVETK